MKEDRYNMCVDQSAQIDCRHTDCKFHEYGSCKNISPAITLNTDYVFTCWSKQLKTEDMKETELQSVPAPEFDPSKPFEVSHDGEHWHTAPHYIGLTSKGKHLVEINDHRTVGTWKHIRNIEPFHAGMLEVGEWIEITAIGPYEGWIAQKMQNTYLYCPEYAAVIVKDGIKGRRVNVNITTEEY